MEYQEDEVQTKEPQDLRSGVAHEEEGQLKIPQDLRGRGQEEKEPKIIQEQEKMEAIPALEKNKIQNTTYGNITTN